MGAMAFRFGAFVSACYLSLFAVATTPTAAADPAGTLPPMNSGSGGSIIGGGSSAGISQQLFSFDSPNVQEADGSDAAQFITAAAAVSDRQLAAPFALLRRGLACQANGAGFGARAYRRNDGKWGGAMLVAAKSSTPDVDALVSCAKTNWRRATAGTQTSLCNSGWATPKSFSRNPGETYYIMLAGTADDFCSALNAKYKNDFSGWPL